MRDSEFCSSNSAVAAASISNNTSDGVFGAYAYYSANAETACSELLNKKSITILTKNYFVRISPNGQGVKRKFSVFFAEGNLIRGNLLSGPCWCFGVFCLSAVFDT